VTLAAGFKWCPGTELNRHAPFRARDFKSLVAFLLVPQNQTLPTTYQFAAWQSAPEYAHVQPCDGDDWGMILLFRLFESLVDRGGAHARTLGRQPFCRAGLRGPRDGGQEDALFCPRVISLMVGSASGSAFGLEGVASRHSLPPKNKKTGRCFKSYRVQVRGRFRGVRKIRATGSYLIERTAYVPVA
jgi:hypothetical protein